MNCAQLPSPLALKKKTPLSFSQKETISNFRQELQNLWKKQDRFILLVGPCSIHNTDSLLNYAKKLKELSTLVDKHFLIILRAYIEKPRTSLGWKGFLHQPDLKKKPNLEKGLFLSRQLFLKITDIGLPIAMEFVDPYSAYYFDDLVTWGCIGARTASSQPHRHLASCFDFPVGFKNSIDGNVDIAIDGILTASYPQNFCGINSKGKISSINSNGNPFAHLILRGGNENTNYDSFSIQETSKKMIASSLYPRIIIDCSHGNSKKNLIKQKQIFIEVIEKLLETKLPIFGLMIESFLKEGYQKISSVIDPDLSITDPCLGWEETKDLILWAHHALSKQSTFNPDLHQLN